LLATWSDRVLSLDARVGREAGALSDRALATGRYPGFAYVVIAATAGTHELVLLTQNGRHFASLDVVFIDPFNALPARS
jgi:hypothetical protein